MVFITAVIREVEESFDPGLTMFWSLPVHSVGQHHDDARLDTPLSLSTADQVVDHDFSPVHEISKLGFPNDQRVRIYNRVTVFKPKNPVLTQMTVRYIHISRNRFQEEILVNIPFLVAYQRVTLRERTSLTILA